MVAELPYPSLRATAIATLGAWIIAIADAKRPRVRRFQSCEKLFIDLT
jgi:hypothetical protein